MAEGLGPPLLERVKRRLTNMPDKEFNVLVVGMAGSGKSSFINSMNMAVTGNWKEVAHYSNSRHAVTKSLDRCVMLDDNCKEVDEPHPVPEYKKNVAFWDCKGFNDADEEVYSTFVSLTVDGRIPNGTKVSDCLNKSSRELKSKFKRVDHNMVFDRIVFILASTHDVPHNLVEAVKTAAQDDHDVPVIVVVTKIDLCSEHELQQRVLDAKTAFHLNTNAVRFKTTSLYCEALTPCTDPNDYRVMMPDEEIDKSLLNIWMGITDPNIKAKPRAPRPPWSPCRPM